jgi:hypothetical protein
MRRLDLQIRGGSYTFLNPEGFVLPRSGTFPLPEFGEGQGWSSTARHPAADAGRSRESAHRAAL